MGEKNMYKGLKKKGLTEFNTKSQVYKKTGEVKVVWKTFKKSLNLLLRPTELSYDEMSQAENILLTKSGVPTGRWGTKHCRICGSKEELQLHHRTYKHLFKRLLCKWKDLIMKLNKGGKKI